MKEFFWLFPIIFIFHDMEEIIGLKIWINKNKTLLENKYPKISKLFTDFSTEGFAVAVYEELIICIIFSGLAYFIEFSIFAYLWLGAFIGCTLHFIVHILQACIIRKYIPALITSIICLPISVFIIYKCFLSTEITTFPIICMILGVILVAVNLIFAQKLIKWYTKLTKK